jgi:hypothetical protein
MINKVQAGTGGARHPFVVPRAVLPGLAFRVVHQLLNITPRNRALKNDCLHDGKTSSRLWAVFLIGFKLMEANPFHSEVML